MTNVGTRRSNRLRLSRGIAAFQSWFVHKRTPQPGVFVKYPPQLSAADEVANWITHGVAAVASLAGAIWLIAKAAQQGEPLMTLACAAFAISLTTVFSMSALSHVVVPPRLRQMFRTLDQAAIFLLIAASASPFFVRFLVPYGWGWLLLLMWGIALLAVWLKLRGLAVNSVLVIYNVVFAWLPMIAARPLFTHMPAGCRVLVVTTGALYMLGVCFLVYDERRQFFHAVWHVLVVAASACTFVAISIYVI
jgi:hemolysin III